MYGQHANRASRWAHDVLIELANEVAGVICILRIQIHIADPRTSLAESGKSDTTKAQLRRAPGIDCDLATVAAQEYAIIRLLYCTISWSSRSRK